MPWDVAFALPYDKALGAVVAMGQIDGGVFDWSQMRWQERK